MDTRYVFGSPETRMPTEVENWGDEEEPDIFYDYDKVVLCVVTRQPEGGFTARSTRREILNHDYPPSASFHDVQEWLHHDLGTTYVTRDREEALERLGRMTDSYLPCEEAERVLRHLETAYHTR